MKKNQKHFLKVQINSGQHYYIILSGQSNLGTIHQKVCEAGGRTDRERVGTRDPVGPPDKI